jgi:hypothetical protein
MIGIIAVSFQERHAVYRRARHETNVTRDCCTRRAVMAAKKCPAPGGDETALNPSHRDGARRASGQCGIIRAPGLTLAVPAGHAKTCWPANAGQGGTGGGGGGGSGERNGQDGD